MKKIPVLRPVLSALPVLVLCLGMVLPCMAPGKAGASDAEAILVAADSGSLPVIPRVPERSRRAPQRNPGTSPQNVVTPPAPTVVSPPAAAVITPPANVPAPVVTTPVPVTAPGRAAPVATPPAMPQVASPSPVITAPIDEPSPVVVKPKSRPARQTYSEGSSPAPRKKRYNPKLVLDPSPAEPYVTKEIYLDGSGPGMAGYGNDRPVWMVDVPTPGPGPAPVPVYAQPSPAPSAGAGTLIPGGGVPLYSTQQAGVSNPLPFEPRTYVDSRHFYGRAVGSTPGGVGGHGGYPGAIGSPWPSDSAVVYVDVPPERVSGALGSERARDRITQMPTLPDDRIMPRGAYEPDPDKVRPLRPRR